MRVVFFAASSFGRSRADGRMGSAYRTSMSEVDLGMELSWETVQS
jgi:hypothetical protein